MKRIFKIIKNRCYNCETPNKSRALIPGEVMVKGCDNCGAKLTFHCERKGAA